MSENWVYNLDLLAQNGVINYDAASFIKGQPPRYIGNPKNPPASNQQVLLEMPEAPLISQPEVDEFKKQVKEDKENGLVKPPLWKKILFGGLLAAGIVFVLAKVAKRIPFLK